jgi:lysophospholipase L1-like esterase
MLRTLLQLVRRILFRLRYEIRRSVDRIKPLPRGRALWVFGHSYAAGNNDGVEPWPMRLAPMLGLPLRNLAVPGDRVAATEQLAKIDRQRPDRRDIVLVEVGVNDTLYFGTDAAAHAAFRRDLAAVVTRLSAHGAPVVVVVDGPLQDWEIESPYDRGSDAAAAAYADDARSVGVPVIDIGAAPAADGTVWDRAAMLLPDKVHPNDTGAAHIAAAVAEGLRAHDLL